jgi:FHA domain
VINSRDGVLLALTGNQLTMLVAGVAVVMVVIIWLCIKAMSQPVAGYQSGGDPVNRDEMPLADAREQDGPAEKPRNRTPGFVLPLPSDTEPAETPMAEPPLPRTPIPPPIERGSPAEVWPIPTEQTVDIRRAAAVTKEPDVPLQEEAPQAAANTQHSLLVFRSGAREGEIIRLDSFSSGQCAIGRSDVPQNQVVIRDDLKVSRVQHAILTCESLGGYSIRDNNSANKVFVNDRCIESAPVPLNHGDKIRIGLTEFEYLQEPVS